VRARSLVRWEGLSVVGPKGLNGPNGLNGPKVSTPFRPSDHQTKPSANRAFGLNGRSKEPPGNTARLGLAIGVLEPGPSGQPAQMIVGHRTSGRNSLSHLVQGACTVGRGHTPGTSQPFSGGYGTGTGAHHGRTGRALGGIPEPLGALGQGPTARGRSRTVGHVEACSGLLGPQHPADYAATQGHRAALCVKHVRQVTPPGPFVPAARPAGPDRLARGLGIAAAVFSMHSASARGPVRDKAVEQITKTVRRAA